MTPPPKQEHTIVFDVRYKIFFFLGNPIVSFLPNDPPNSKWDGVPKGARDFM